MFNIIETLQSYFTRKLLPYNISSEVALCFNISLWRPYLVVNCSEKVFVPTRSAAAVVQAQPEYY